MNNYQKAFDQQFEKPLEKIASLQEELKKAIKAKEKRDEEFIGDEHEFYESCYVPERDC